MADLKAPKDGLIALGSDHAGFAYKERIKALLQDAGVRFHDFGATSDEPSDYVDYARTVAEAVSSGKVDHGILVCGSGVGMSIAADKIPGVRSALCSDTYTARVCREHNDANILTLAERVIGIEVALDIVRVWIKTPFSGEERHIRRLAKIRAIEEAYGEATRREAKGCVGAGPADEVSADAGRG